MDDLSYWLALHKASGIGPATFNQLFEHFPNPDVLLSSPEVLEELDLTPARKLAVQKAIQEPDWKAVEQELLWSETPENHILLLTHSQYPELLKQIHAPPPLLFVYARHGHKLMGCKSPVGGSPLCKLYPTI
ncbi:MAG: hypothetical protein KZQ70_02470, partial [gamma proteobacterium symbiont of Lucinoma myriamae]|nr:hypothetical protein [gamma proteobacterium symbiont of Lucinoma myriamae]MCU7818580.1 hypothetical protein [gamma proteobacterium symbiont of Lucinoma myriamae]MCU7831460.1 hypothetical protein [gamma proteobacterium symbiont of Lucinoma myriamae]